MTLSEEGLYDSHQPQAVFSWSIQPFVPHPGLFSLLSFPSLAVSQVSPWAAWRGSGCFPLQQPPAPILSSLKVCVGRGSLGGRICWVVGWIFRDIGSPRFSSCISPLGLLPLSIVSKIPLWPQPCAVHLQPHKDPPSYQLLSFPRSLPFGGCGICDEPLICSCALVFAQLPVTCAALPNSICRNSLWICSNEECPGR